VDLWNQWVTAGIWLQNIDSRDFACKFFGMKNLRATKADPYDLQQEKQRQKQTKARQTKAKRKKAARCAARSREFSISIVAIRRKLTCSDFSAGFAAWFVVVAGDFHLCRGLTGFGGSVGQAAAVEALFSSTS
jgi:hypothetical protein